MIRIDKTIIVEGAYDKIKLSGVVDAHIIATGGFRIFKDKEMKDLICRLAKETGIIILTDSDRAGFVIRNHIKSFCKEGEILNVYIPDIKGKEKRKATPSKEGLLGVEGIDLSLLESLLAEADGSKEKEEVSYSEFYNDGFCGGANSREKRNILCEKLGLPKRLSAKELLKVINRLYTKEQYEQLKGGK